MIIRDFTKLPLLAEGGEGLLYRYKGMVIKCYKPCVDLAAKQRKVQLLMSKTLPKEVVCPKEEVLDKKKQFVGYAMQAVSGEEFRMLSNKKYIKANHISTKEILQMLLCIKETISKLHAQNIYLGDLNDQNILFDEKGQIYLIDCDSWTIENERCQVAMDLFKDPLLLGDAFDEKTDFYAFCVLAFKALTRIHPFGGTMSPDLHILERMARGISVIDNPSVKIPRTAKSWRNLSPDLLKALKAVFEDGVRTMGEELSEMALNLKYCNTDKEYYYGGYTVCPLCDKQATVLITPVSQGAVTTIKLTALLQQSDIEMVLNPYLYINKKNEVVDLRSGKREAYTSGKRYYFTDSQVMVVEDREYFCIHGKERYHFDKRYKSTIVVEGDCVYYRNQQNSLCKVTVHPLGNHILPLCTCANTAYFEVSDGHYGVFNIYDSKIIFHSDGYNCEILHKKPVLTYGLHYDKATDAWLVVMEDASGGYRTLILHQTTMLFDTEQLLYSCPLGNLCIFHHTIFFPMDGKIRGYAYQKNQYKDFTCDVVDTDSRLIRRKKQFLIVKEENLYTFGG